MRTPPAVMPALVTPFTSDGELDAESHRHNLRTLADMDVEGFVIAGSTGEGPYLDPGERADLVAAARDELGDDPFLMCGIAAQSLRQATAQVAEAHDAGADAALVLTPTTLVRGNDGAVRAATGLSRRATTFPNSRTNATIQRRRRPTAKSSIRRSMPFANAATRRWP